MPMVLPVFRVGFPSSVKPPWKHPEMNLLDKSKSRKAEMKTKYTYKYTPCQHDLNWSL